MAERNEQHRERFPPEEIGGEPQRSYLRIGLPQTRQPFVVSMAMAWRPGAAGAHVALAWAAGVVTAIGFIGSGIIIFRNNSVNGITTSAGIWATVGVGMSMGAGMYILGAVSTAIVMLSELFLGRKGYFSRRNGEDKEVEIEYCESLDEDIFQFINRTLQDQNCKMVNIQLTEEASTYVLTAQLKTPADYDMSGLVGELKKKGQLKRISVQ